MRCLTPTDDGKSLDRSSLLGDHAASAEPGEAAAQRGKRRHGRGESPAPGFGNELAALGKSRFSNRSNQALVIDLRCQQGVVRAPRQAPLYRAAPVGEKIELLFRHPVIMCGVAAVSNQQMNDTNRKDPVAFVSYRHTLGDESLQLADSVGRPLTVELPPDVIARVSTALAASAVASSGSAAGMLETACCRLASEKTVGFGHLIRKRMAKRRSYRSNRNVAGTRLVSRNACPEMVRPRSRFRPCSRLAGGRRMESSLTAFVGRLLWPPKIVRFMPPLPPFVSGAVCVPQVNEFGSLEGVVAPFIAKLRWRYPAVPYRLGSDRRVNGPKLSAPNT